MEEDAFFYTILLILVGFTSFGLGRQSVVQKSQNALINQPAGVILNEPTETKVVVKDDLVRVVASRSGKKYYLPTCSGVSRIKEENKIYFDSPNLALAAGYTPAANCPGLQ